MAASLGWCCRHLSHRLTTTSNLPAHRSITYPRSLLLSRLETNKHLQIALPLSTKYQAVLGWKRDCDVHIYGKEFVSFDKCCRITFSRILCTRSSLGQPSEGGIASSRDSKNDSRDKQKITGRPFQFAAKVAKSILTRLVKVALSLFLLISLGFAGAPSFLSSQSGLHVAVSLANRAIPGHATIQSMSLGWSKPVVVEGISLKGVDGEVVLTVSKLETKASLWLLVRGKAGFGDCTIISPKVDLREEKSTGIPNIALALAPPSRLMKSRRRAKVFAQHAKKKVESAVDIALSATIKAPTGGLEVTDGKLIVPGDIAAVLGHRVLIGILMGHWAVEENKELKEFYQSKLGSLPIKAELWSDASQAEAVGFLNSRKLEIELIRPMKVEMDLNPAVGQLYLAQINPLLGEIVGPAVQDEDMPDVVLYVSPENLVLPAEQFRVHFEPMKAILARGPLAGGILSLLTKGKEDIARGRKEVTLQTSAIEAIVGMDGSLKCSRIDFLIAGKVHVATWGEVDWIGKTLRMTLAIPSTTFKDVLGLDLSKGYHLKIPVGGTFERPLVDWKAAGVGVAQLSLQQRSGRFMKNILAMFDAHEESVPEPLGNLPWIPVKT